MTSRRRQSDGLERKIRSAQNLSAPALRVCRPAAWRIATRRYFVTSRSTSKAADGGPEICRVRRDGRGDVFDKLRLKGTVDLLKGIVTLEGELPGLTLSETLRRRIPVEARPIVNSLALNSGVVDIELKRFRYDPTAAPGGRLQLPGAGPAA